MAYDAFLVLDGVKGETTDDAMSKKGAMEIYSFSWGASNPTTIGSTTTGSGGGKVSLSSFSCMKKLDNASPNLLKNCCIGDHYKTGSVMLRKAGGAQDIYLQYDLTEVYVESYQVSGSSGGDDQPTESVSFTFAQVTMKYTPQTKEGKPGTAVTAGWNVTTNKPT